MSKVLYIVLFVSCLTTVGTQDISRLMSDAEQTALNRVIASADYAVELSELLAGYSGAQAALCQTKLTEKEWYCELKRVVQRAVAEIEAIYKTTRCLGETTSPPGNKLDSVLDNYLRVIRDIKRSVLEDQRVFMDHCVHNASDDILENAF